MFSELCRKLFESHRLFEDCKAFLLPNNFRAHLGEAQVVSSNYLSIIFVIIIIIYLFIHHLLACQCYLINSTYMSGHYLDSDVLFKKRFIQKLGHPTNVILEMKSKSFSCLWHCVKIYSLRGISKLFCSSVSSVKSHPLVIRE